MHRTADFLLFRHHLNHIFGKIFGVICHKTQAEIPVYFTYLFKSVTFIEKMNSLTVGIREGKNIQYGDFANTPIPIPPLNEQTKISLYLSKQTKKLDDFVSREKSIIDQMTAYKQSLITETVTHGLHPEVPLRDSGVEWIGEIPEHWKMIRLKFLLDSVTDCPHETPDYSEDGEYFVIRTADQGIGKLCDDEQMFRLSAEEYEKRTRRMTVEKNDIVYGREGANWGKACLVPQNNKYCLGQRMMQLRCNTAKFWPQFASFALNAKGVYLQGVVDTFGSASPHVNISTVINYQIPTPPLAEQRDIADFLDAKCATIDADIAKRRALIEQLADYKRSLIYEVVTGKREVE